MARIPQPGRLVPASRRAGGEGERAGRAHPAAPKAQCFLIPGRAGEVTHSDYESELEGGIRPLAGKQRGGTDFTNLTLEYKSLCRV